MFLAAFSNKEIQDTAFSVVTVAMAASVAVILLLVCAVVIYEVIKWMRGKQ